MIGCEGIDPMRRIEVMGIVNLTPDSFFEGSRAMSIDAALSRAAQMVSEGADILDLGACSTRPGAEYVSVSEEWQRLEGPLKAIREAFPLLRLSVDTFRSEIVRRAFDAVGEIIVNDISAGEEDPGMLPVVGSLGLPYVAMHKRGNPSTMASLTDYPEGVVAAVRSYFSEFASRADRADIGEWILDPGFGFAKSIEQNYELLAHLDEVLVPGHRTLVGLSRKSMIYKPLGITPEESLPQTQVLNLAALERGADILRVHDVAEAVRTVATYRRLSL